MNIRENNGVAYLVFDIYNDISWLKHCFSTRIGGVSKGVCQSMNLRFSKPDDTANVYENFKIMSKAVGFSYEGFTFSDQMHHTNLRRITKSDMGKGLHRAKDYSDVDGIMTNEAGIALTTYHADCAPLFFVDKANKAAALCHAGWKGTVNGIGAKTVKKMASEFGSKQEDLLVGIGPCIGYCCFEVDRPVYDEFKDKLSFFDSYTKEIENTAGKYLIDLAGINKEILIRSGVRAENIEISAMCTKCEEEKFFSHRRSGLSRGSMVAIMEIVDESHRI